MTVSDTTNRTSVDGSATAGQSIPFYFPIVNTSDIEVKTRVITTGVEATLDETTDYTVTISDDEGGWVEMVNAIAATYEIHIIRVTPLTQLLDLVHGGAFSAGNIEAQFDKLARSIIDLGDSVNRCLVIPDTDDGTLTLSLPNEIDRASKYLSFDALGNVSATALTATGTISVSGFAETMLDDADAGAVLTTLGVSAFVQTIFNDAAATNVRTTLGLAIGTNVQAYDADLGTIAALTHTANYFMVANSGGTAWSQVAPATVVTTLGLNAMSDVVCNNNAVVCNNNTVVTN